MRSERSAPTLRAVATEFYRFQLAKTIPRAAYTTIMRTKEQLFLQ